jgi:hypothetical protein
MRRLSPAKVVAARMTDAPHAKFDAGSNILIATGERRRRHRPVLKAAPEQL